MTLVTGAGGKTGQAVIRALVARGVRPRALARRPEQVDELLSIGAAEAVQGDLLDASSLEPAFSGIRAVATSDPTSHMHSVMAPEVQAMPHHWSKHLVEQWLIESGLAHTILQPASYMQNVRGVWPSIMDGALSCPLPDGCTVQPRGPGRCGTSSGRDPHRIGP